MANTEDAASLEANQGEKMIEVKLRFWTNEITPEHGKGIIPKHAWTAGVIRMERNKSHSIVPENPRPFHSLLDIGAVVEKGFSNTASLSTVVGRCGNTLRRNSANTRFRVPFTCLSSTYTRFRQLSVKVLILAAGIERNAGLVEPRL
jgi:hypothetical protein